MWQNDFNFNHRSGWPFLPLYTPKRPKTHSYSFENSWKEPTKSVIIHPKESESSYQPKVLWFPPNVLQIIHKRFKLHTSAINYAKLSQFPTNCWKWDQKQNHKMKLTIWWHQFVIADNHATSQFLGRVPRLELIEPIMRDIG